VQAFRTIAPLAGSRERFGVAMVIVNAVAQLVIVAALIWGWGVEAAACYLLITASLADLFYLRTDLWSTALATFGVAAWRRKRPSVAALGFAGGAAFKLWPMTFLPLLLVPPGARRIAPLATAAAAGIAVLGLWLWVAGPAGLYQVLTFRGAQGWEIETMVGSVWLAIDPSSLRFETGTWRIGAISGATSIALFAVGTVTSLWMVWRGARTGHLGAGWAGGIAALLAVSALLSPQFVCWLAPAAGLAWVERDKRLAVLTAVLIFFTNLEFRSFNPLLRSQTDAIILLLVRNALLVAFVVYTVRLVSRAALVGSGSGKQTRSPSQ
jgi:hypothetical protein